ncbi:MAG: hypothetical protein CMP65_05240 [Flavobacteriales bacterium]|nr:hypothetical protein [Flavobacteriales bacterium]|tara:strand:+ start:1330 stop:1983 length:654 start_codon:yes stop_codon:yes gene_type:complete
MKKLHALVLGATGSTGQELVKFLLDNPHFYKVSVFVRKSMNMKHKKLIVHKVDFSCLKKYKYLVKGDVLFSSLGTTRKEAGSKEKQYLVDYIYQYKFAKMASENLVGHYSLVSSLGADHKSHFFYLRIKGELEESIKNLTFKTIHIFQPPSLIRQPELIRNGEKITLMILNILNSLGVLISFKPLSVKKLAIKMVKELKSKNSEKITVYKANDLFMR